MFRLHVGIVVVLVMCTAPAHADVFDRYTNPVLNKVPEAAGVKEITKLTQEMIIENSNLIPNSSSALIVVKTNGGLNSKLLVQMARQRTGTDTVPIALIERFVTYKATQERAIVASGQNLHLYKDFLLNLDIGQVAPSEVGGDLRLVVEKEKGALVPVGKAKMYLVTKAIPGTEAVKSTKPTIGDVFEPQYFNGTYRLQDDGRRSAKVTLKVDGDGQVTGDYVSDKSGQKYEIMGKVTSPKHMIQFTVKFPQAAQTFQGWMFTRDGSTICGSTRLQEHEFGFFAVRLDEE